MSYMYSTLQLEIAPSAFMGFNSSMAGAISIFPKLVIDIRHAIADKDIGRAKDLQMKLNQRMGAILSQGKMTKKNYN